MTPDQFRLTQTASRSRLTGLAHELPGLRSMSRFMMSGAHPDDECAPMLAALHFRDGVNLSYACSTRGEGGQNNLGTERGPALGALRTAEMEAACDALNMRMYWLSQTPEDTITDWRFSKSGDETLARWGHARTLRRMVEILRRDRPDILCPTFLDVPGQHGHHRAMTRIAHEAFESAADPAFDTGQAPWAVAKLYLPAWSGAGRAYDDDLPPPPATVTIPGGGAEPWTGHSYALLGAISHGQHRSQGMGHWPGEPRDFPLHLAETRVGSDTGAVTDNLPHSFADLGLPALDQAIDALDPVSDCSAALAEIHAQLTALDLPEHQHRIEAKRRQIARLMAITAAQVPVTHAAQTQLRNGERTDIHGLPEAAQLRVPEDWIADGTSLGPQRATPDQGYRDSYDPHLPPLPHIVVTTQGVPSHWPLSQPLHVLPEISLDLPQPLAMANLATGAQQITLPIAPGVAAGTATATEDGLTLDIPPKGRHDLPLTVAGQPAYQTRQIDYPHIRPTQFATPAILHLSVINAALPGHGVSYIGAGLDTVPERLREIGIEVSPFETLDTLQPTLVVGIHTFGFAPHLREAAPQLRAWVEAGGNLVTLYHRPWDGWDADKTPPRRIEIGQPSLRWRVTQKEAPVTVLRPDHPLMTGPNPITAEAFEGWDKERGLYFAKNWDTAYTPLIAAADEGEEPLTGALLVGQIGQGQHVHVALNLHHQLEHGVEGAIRLLCNCLQNPDERSSA